MTSAGVAAIQIRGYLDHLAVEQGASAHTLSAYRRDLEKYRQFLAESGVGDLEAVTEGHVEQFRDLRDGAGFLEATQDHAPDGVCHLVHQVEVVEVAAFFRRFEALDGHPAVVTVVVGRHAPERTVHQT